jgi:2-iminobutanoate/2-iminopropanoate deaminase
MEKKIIYTENAPKPVGPYNQAVLAGDTLYISGQIPINPVSNVIIDSDISLATKQVMDNLGAILTEAGMTFNNVVKCTIFISDMARFKDVNAVYFNYFTNDFPARETVEVSALPLNALVEISAIAVK